ncbi:MAG: hypothetical protein ACK5JR_12340 [Tropicimonas sp.]|uniref:phosphoribosylanthranilate isomerase n=1 Tax=Tropicimonas sp. TaxID=2067044 RepID=UPI003A8353A3
MRRIKICGITGPDEIEAIARHPVSLYGLWYGCGGRHDLDLDELAWLANGGQGSGAARPCLVTFLSDPERILKALRHSGIGVVQLHGFCLPRQVRALRERLDSLSWRVEILKVLHVKDGVCAEERLIGAYRDCGATGFILDAYAGREAVGSTGERVGAATARALTARLAPLPVWLAGGIGAEFLDGFAADPVFAGFDIDSHARTAGRICPERLAAIFAAHVRLLSRLREDPHAAA